jgi:hypothetical protein
LKLFSRRQGWLWFFVGLGVLTGIAVFVQVWYNAGQQLTDIKLNAARAKWKENGPHDYDMEYTIRQSDEPGDNYVVQVRQGKVTNATRNGEPLAERLYQYQTMSALFSFMEEFLERDGKAGNPRAFAVAVFDPGDGHLVRYVRSVMSTRERQEIRVKFQQL